MDFTSLGNTGWAIAVIELLIILYLVISRFNRALPIGDIRNELRSKQLERERDADVLDAQDEREHFIQNAIAASIEEDSSPENILMQLQVCRDCAIVPDNFLIIRHQNIIYDVKNEINALSSLEELDDFDYDVRLDEPFEGRDNEGPVFPINADQIKRKLSRRRVEFERRAMNDAIEVEDRRPKEDVIHPVLLIEPERDLYSPHETAEEASDEELEPVVSNSDIEESSSEDKPLH